MPSQRKRIGFLPSEEVQNIIDQICKQNKLSQSKVTGILVKEALNFRGMLNSSVNNKSTKMHCNNNKSLLTNDEGIINAVDENVETTACNGKANCNNSSQCLSHNLWEDLGAEINNFLSDVTLQQVISKNNESMKEIKLSEY